MQKRGHHGAVQYMTCPQSRRLERADQPAFFSLVREGFSERAGQIDPVTEEFGGRRRLTLDVNGHVSRET
ncbi:hypothetical protein GCM10028798_02670 [Humibacter antri]